MHGTEGERTKYDEWGAYARCRCADCVAWRIHEELSKRGDVACGCGGCGE